MNLARPLAVAEWASDALPDDLAWRRVPSCASNATISVANLEANTM
jgi:hypothetical protein